MALIRHKTSKATARKKASCAEGEKEKSTYHKILTAEGWKRLMTGRRGKGTKVKD